MVTIWLLSTLKPTIRYLLITHVYLICSDNYLESITIFLTDPVHSEARRIHLQLFHTKENFPFAQ